MSRLLSLDKLFARFLLSGRGEKGADDPAQNLVGGARATAQNRHVPRTFRQTYRPYCTESWGEFQRQKQEILKGRRSIRRVLDRREIASDCWGLSRSFEGSICGLEFSSV